MRMCRTSHDDGIAGAVCARATTPSSAAANNSTQTFAAMAILMWPRSEGAIYVVRHDIEETHKLTKPSLRWRRRR
jgi:hypothetical protein